MMSDEMECPGCGRYIRESDSTIDPRGVINGAIHYCEDCDQYYLFVLKTGEIKTWEY